MRLKRAGEASWNEDLAERGNKHGGDSNGHASQKKMINTNFSKKGGFLSRRICHVSVWWKSSYDVESAILAVKYCFGRVSLLVCYPHFALNLHAIGNCTFVLAMEFIKWYALCCKTYRWISMTHLSLQHTVYDIAAWVLRDLQCHFVWKTPP